MVKDLDEAEVATGKSVAGAAGGLLYVGFLLLVGFLRGVYALYRLVLGKPTPEFEPLHGNGWQNVAQNQFCRPSSVLRVENRQQLVDAISEARRTGRRVRAIGSGHSFSDVAVADDTLLALRGLNRVLDLDTRQLRDTAPEHLVRVESGISIRELNQALKERGLALLNMGSYDAQTISGAISTGTHGSGEALGALADVVRSLDFVDESGRVQRIEPASGITDPARYQAGSEGAMLVQDDDLFHSVVVAMGCLGVVYSYVLEVRSRYFLRETRELVGFDELKKRLLARDFAPRTGPSKGMQPRHFEFLVSPYPLKDGQAPQCLVTYRVEAEIDGKTRKARTRNPLLVILTSARAFDDIVALALSTFPSLTPFLLARSLTSLVDDEYVAESYEVLNLGDANFIPAYSSELAFSAEPGDAGPEYVRALEELLVLARQQARLGRWHTAPISVRFVRESPHFLAMSHARASAIFEIPMLARVPSGWDLLRYYERVFFDGYRARPHWGQANFIIGPDRLAQMYPRLDAFVASYRRLCPHGTFDNSFSERLGLRTLAGLAKGKT